MTGHGEKLTRKQESAIAALISEPTVLQAAQRTGVGDTTLWRWMKEPEFQAAYKDARRQVMNTAIGRIQDTCTEAVETLRAIMQDTNASASSRVSAAKSVLEIGLRAMELQDMEERITQLEDIAQANRWGKAA
jgi:hypothetical protein